MLRKQIGKLKKLMMKLQKLTKTGKILLSKPGLKLRKVYEIEKLKSLAKQNST